MEAVVVGSTLNFKALQKLSNTAMKIIGAPAGKEVHPLRRQLCQVIRHPMSRLLEPVIATPSTLA